jgi:ferredoxin--NADP+ reductase
MAQWLDAQVTERINWYDHLFSLRFNCEAFPAFKAGQFTKIGIEQSDGKILSRPYSLVNGPAADQLEVIAVPVEDGQLSPKLHQLQSADKLKVMAPATGFLVLDEVPQSEHIWMLATGTGVGPFLSILAGSEVWEKYQTVILVYAARKLDDLAYLDTIKQWQQRYPEQFKFVPVVSREKSDWTLAGRIPSLLADNTIQNSVSCQLSIESSQTMLCGNPQMIQDSIVVLENMGLKKHLRRAPGQISMERYW